MPSTSQSQRSGVRFRRLQTTLYRTAQWLLLCCFAVMIPALAQTATTTTLTITSGGSAITTVSSGTVVTLTATVMAGSTAVTPGQVKFCDTSVSYCTDIFLVATSQLVGTTGTAVYKFRPGPGSHNYKAVFPGTKTYAGSSSSVSSLDVTGPPFTSVTGISALQTGSNWTLTAKVSGGISATESPTGTISFIDTTRGNVVRATAPLGPGTQALGFSNTSAAIRSTTVNAVVADFNLDGIPDVLTSDTGYPALVTYQGNGDGTFKLVNAEYIPGYGVGFAVGFANGLAVADFNSDGVPDVAMADGWFPLSIYLGNGDGSFQGQSPDVHASPVGSGNQYVAVADFNGDGIPDLVVGSGGGGYSFTDIVSLQVFLGKGDGTFGSPLTLEFIISDRNWFAPAPFPAVGDFNGDGIPDLAVADPNSGKVSIYLGKGDGTFGTPSTLITGAGYNTVAVADFNKDGKLDLAVTNSSGNTVSIFLGNGNGTFTPADQSPQTGSQPSAMTVGDFNGDGIPDLAVYNFSGGYSNSNATILLGKGDGTFTPSASQGPATTPNSAIVYGFGSGWPWIASGDLNGDGLTDLVVPDNLVYLTQAGWTATAEANFTLKGIGTDQIAASYPGDTDLNPSVSGTVGVTAVTLPTMSSPAPGSQLSGSTATFQWTAGSDVTAYELSVGTTGPGSSNIYSPSAVTSTSAAVSGLPTNGATVYVTLSSEINGVWQPQYYSYTASAPASAPALTSPTPGSQLSGSSATFTWTAGTGSISQYALLVGTTSPGSSNLSTYNGLASITSTTVSGLPKNGLNIYVTLEYEIGGVWSSLQYTYTAAGSTAPPALTSPIPGSQLSGSSVAFTWSPGSGVTAYELEIGTYGPGYFNTYGSGVITATSATAPNLPTNGKPVYVTLRYEINGVWNSLYYTYTASGAVIPPVMTSPAPSSQLSGSSVAFTWSPGSGVTAYELEIGTYGPGYFNTYGSGVITTTSATAPNLPTNGKPVYVTLKYEIPGGTWEQIYYTYTAAP